MERIILHSDLNNFYASVECLYKPELKRLPVAVAGSTEDRRGIILAKNQEAKLMGVKTGEVIWQAKVKCPDLICLKPNYSRYIAFSKMVRSIYEDYTDQVENFGLDECWLDVTGSKNLFGDGFTIANEIRRRIKEEIGITASIGVSFNKIFAKLGSDMRKPDYTTVIPKESFLETIGNLPAGDLLLVGRATQKKLRALGVHTIKELAHYPEAILRKKIGKMGTLIWKFANGLDESVVVKKDFRKRVKSVGNSTTLKEGADSLEALKPVLYRLSESVTMRLRESQLKAQGLQIYLRKENLEYFERQKSFLSPTCLTRVFVKEALDIIASNYDFHMPVRSVGIRSIELIDEKCYQLNIYEEDTAKEEALENSLDDIRNRYGNLALTRGVVMKDRFINGLDIKGSNVIFPVSYFK